MPVQDPKKYSNIFRAYDVRGIMGQDMSPEIMYQIGQAVAAEQLADSTANTCFVSGDYRTSSDMLSYALIGGITSQGMNVIHSGRKTPFGVALFSGSHLKTDFTAFITASHLHPEWNGIKFYHNDGVGFAEEKNMKIRDRFVANNFSPVEWQKSGQVSIAVAEDEYKEHLVKKFQLERKLKVVIDCGNGSTSRVVPDIFRQIGFDVVELFCDVNSIKPQRDWEPDEKSLKPLAETVIKEKAAFGVGFDGDGDRAIIIDEKGQMLFTERTGIMLAKEIIKQEQIKKPVIIANVECSMAIEDAFPEATVKRIRVGHTFLTLEAKQYGKNAVIGIESSGHMVIPPVFLFDDAVPIPLLLGQLLSKQDGVSLSDYSKTVPSYPRKKGQFDCSDQTKFQAIERLTTTFSQDYDVNTIDGIRITLDDGSWALIRASNTSPIIRITVEGRSLKRAEEIYNQFAKVINAELKK